MRALFFPLLLAATFIARADQVDVLVYGATPAGVAAALAAAQDGEKVMLVEPSSRIGGIMTNGLCEGDFRTFESLSGAYWRLTQRVIEAYRPEFGAEAEKVCSRGSHAEPKVLQAIFDRMLAGQPGIELHTNWALEGAECSSEANGDAAGPARSLEVALFAEPQGVRHSVAARTFIDATYEGDLLAAANIPYRAGREASMEFHETLAPDEADGEIQVYNLRLCMTQEAGNRVAPHAPADYRREDFSAVLPFLEKEAVRTVFSAKATGIFHHSRTALPHGKYDIGETFGGPVPLALPGVNAAWPDGGGGVAIREGVTPTLQQPPFSRLGLATSRQRIFEEYRRRTMGLLYFLQHDQAVPEKMREETLSWGWCRDEYPDNGHLPEQLYVREARRLEGRYVFTQNDTERVPGEVRTPLQLDSVAVGDAGLLCFGTEAGPDGALAGGFQRITAPYQVPFGVMLPEQVDNVLVTCAVSASHVGFCALRFEPVWMSLGEAAGHATHLAHQSGRDFQHLDLPQLQARLHAAGAATIYLSDVRPDDPLFAAAQWWGDLGGWHGGKSDTDAAPGAEVPGGYQGAFAHHAADLSRQMGPEETKAWAMRAAEAGIPVEKLPSTLPLLTRGAWLKQAFAASTARK